MAKKRIIRTTVATANSKRCNRPRWCWSRESCCSTTNRSASFATWNFSLIAMPTHAWRDASNATRPSVAGPLKISSNSTRGEFTQSPRVVSYPPDRLALSSPRTMITARQRKSMPTLSCRAAPRMMLPLIWLFATFKWVVWSKTFVWYKFYFEGHSEEVWHNEAKWPQVTQWTPWSRAACSNNWSRSKAAPLIDSRLVKPKEWAQWTTIIIILKKPRHIPHFNQLQATTK